MNKENEKVLNVVDEALRQFHSEILSVDLSNEHYHMIDVNVCTRHSSVFYMCCVAHYDKCYIPELEKELDNRNVKYCW